MLSDGLSVDEEESMVKEIEEGVELPIDFVD